MELELRTFLDDIYALKRERGKTKMVLTRVFNTEYMSSVLGCSDSGLQIQGEGGADRVGGVSYNSLSYG